MRDKKVRYLLMKDVVSYYETYKEEDRLTTNNARKIEFVTTIRILDSIIGGNKNILDCAAGTGRYAFYFADKGHKVTATDITPRHIDYIRNELENKHYSMESFVLDATDMTCFDDETFDVVLNMGPLYHLTEEGKRYQCFTESLRVLKKGGLLVAAYIPRLYLNQMIAMSDIKYLDMEFLNQIKDTGILKHEDPKCFWTDTYYSSYEEMEELFRKHAIKTVKHFAQDGLLPMLKKKADQWNDEQFKMWCDYHCSVCEEKSIIGMSNHVVIVGRK